MSSEISQSQSIFYLYVVPKGSKFNREKRNEISRHWGRGGTGSRCLMGKVWVSYMERALEINGGKSYSTMNYVLNNAKVTILKTILFNFILYVWTFCLCICKCIRCPPRPEEGIESELQWLWATIWFLKTKPGSHKSSINHLSSPKMTHFMWYVFIIVEKKWKKKSLMLKVALGS